MVLIVLSMIAVLGAERPRTHHRWKPCLGRSRYGLMLPKRLRIGKVLSGPTTSPAAPRQTG